MCHYKFQYYYDSYRKSNGLYQPGTGSVSIENYSGYQHQYGYAVAIGNNAGYMTQGTGSISIGNYTLIKGLGLLP